MDKTWTVLVVEPDARLNSLIKATFLDQGLKVLTALDSQSALTQFKEQTVELVICEAQLPKENDFELLEQLRQLTEVPIIILSQLKLDSQKIQGFELGADDYLTKPFNHQELWLRAKRLLHYFYEASPFRQIGQHYVFSFMTFDLSQRSLQIDRKEIPLTPREFDLLKYFVEHPEEVISRAELLKEVWGYELFGDERTVDVHIRKLRLKLGQYSAIAPKSILTVWKRGYRFTSQPMLED